MKLEDDSKDYFDGPDLPDQKKEPKVPVYTPDDPRYWEQDESEFEHLRPGRRYMLWVWVAATGVALGLILTVYFRWFSPYVEGATQYGYVESLERRGTIFDTYEGVLLPYKDLMDTTRSYGGDFVFTCADGDVAVKLRRMQYANLPVRVVYRRYHATLPWRGDSRIIVERVDSVDPSRILPPEFTPETMRRR